MTSCAAAPITANVTDSAYSDPAGQLHGVPELDEQAARVAGLAGAASAAEVRKKVRRVVESCMVMQILQ